MVRTLRIAAALGLGLTLAACGSGPDRSQNLDAMRTAQTVSPVLSSKAAKELFGAKTGPSAARVARPRPVW